MTIQDILDGNIAANLQVQIDKLTGRVAAVEEKVTTHLADDTSHVQVGEREKWNAKQDALPVEQRRPIYVSSTAPLAPVDGDIWIEV